VREPAITILRPGARVCRVIAGSENDGGGLQGQMVLGSAQIHSLHRRGADLHTHLAGPVLEKEAILRDHCITGMIQGRDSPNNCTLGDCGAFFITEATVHTEVWINHPGLPLKGEVEDAIFSAGVGERGVGVKAEARRLKELLQPVFHHAGAAFLAFVGSFAAEMCGPASEKRSFFHQGYG